MTLYYFEVYCDGEYLAIVRAHSEESAIEQVWMRHGSASAYGMRGPRRLYTAKKV